MKENKDLSAKNKKLENLLNSLNDQVGELKTELLNLKVNKKERMNKVKGEAEKYKDYFRIQIDSLRNEMISKKTNMDKMKLLLEHYKSKVTEMEKELAESNDRWSKRCEDERNKWKEYLNH
mmetsp:Transcript_11600/g.10267  ORF Transcript_11600/g.10267 Transcript_11600/m.10267 type:complete len:121 (+) Transcript_11600:557-919(+)